MKTAILATNDDQTERLIRLLGLGFSAWVFADDCEAEPADVTANRKLVDYVTDRLRAAELDASRSAAAIARAKLRAYLHDCDDQPGTYKMLGMDITLDDLRVLASEPVEEIRALPLGKGPPDLSPRALTALGNACRDEAREGARCSFIDPVELARTLYAVADRDTRRERNKVPPAIATPWPPPPNLGAAPVPTFRQRVERLYNDRTNSEALIGEPPGEDAKRLAWAIVDALEAERTPVVNCG